MKAHYAIETDNYRSGILPLASACYLTLLPAGFFLGSSRLTVLPTSWRVAGWRFFEPGGRPGPGLPGFGTLARSGSAWRMFRNPRRTRAGVSLAGRAGPLPGQPQVFGESAGPLQHLDPQVPNHQSPYHASSPEPRRRGERP